MTSNPGWITGGATCSASYANPTTVVLTATADPGSMFGGWLGDCAGVGNGTCTVVTNRNDGITAIFNLLPQLTLTVGKAGTGGGTVTSNPAESLLVSKKAEEP